MIYRDFKKLFTKREIQEINGSKRKNLVILTGILFGTFMAIAISVGGIEYLDHKMNDPFVQNLEIDVPYSKSKEVEFIKSDLNTDSLKKFFQYDTVLAIVVYNRTFYNYRKGDGLTSRGQSIEPGSPILKQVLDKKNLIRGRDFESENDCGLIVTEKLLSDFGYNSDAPFILMKKDRKSLEETGSYYVPVPIIAIVRELPGLAQYVYTPFFYKMITTGGIDDPYDIEDYGKITLFFPGIDKPKSTEVQKSLQEFLSGDSLFRTMEPAINMMNNTDSYIPGYVCDISFYPQPENMDTLNNYYKRISGSAFLRSYSGKFFRYYLYDFPQYPETIIAYDKISVAFNSLSKVKSFKDTLFRKTELVVEMSKVKDKENFIAISILTLSIALMLLVFSVMSVGLFVSNLLRTHLNKIKTNLGTFKAFGLSNSSLQVIYKNIVRRFYLKALFIGYVLASLTDSLISILFFPDLRMFHLLNLYTILAITVIWIIVEYVFAQTSKTILVNTPGDLIYGRDHT